MFCRIFSCTLAVLACASQGQAQQDTVQLVPGQRVRIHQQGKHTLVGAFVAADSVSLAILASPADTVQVPRASITGVDRSVGTRSMVPDGALIGLGVGVVGGVITGALACSPDNNGWNVTQGECMSWGAAAFGLIGALVGALSWSGERTDRWKPTVWPIVTLHPSGAEGKRVALGLHLTF
jgi:hypothetical protein